MLGVSVEAVPPGLFGSPSDVADDRDFQSTDPVAKGVHTIEIPELKGFGKIRVSGEIRSYQT